LSSPGGAIYGVTFLLDRPFYERDLRPMSHVQFYRAILSRNFIARQNRKCDMACHETSQKLCNSFSD